MAYSELIKNFEKIREYMREFYVYGFKTRSDYNAKSLRSYDDEKRRIENWLSDYINATQGESGKSVYISIDSRVSKHNPLYKALKSKSFTDGDITLHFIIFDILFFPETKLSLTEIIIEIDKYLAKINSNLSFDESTIRKKLKEYSEEGIIRIDKDGKKVLYGREKDLDISSLYDVIDFFSEVMPLGVVGSFLQDKYNKHSEIFSFKHNYITHAIDSEVLEIIFQAMREKKYLLVNNMGKAKKVLSTKKVVPLKVLISAQNGKQNLVAFHPDTSTLKTYRIDYLKDLQVLETVENIEAIKESFKKIEKHMWGVNCRWKLKKLERVAFTVYVGKDEQYIVRRLEREKRCGTVTKIDGNHYKYEASVFETTELIPWIRTFICRITRLNFSNRTIENSFKKDILDMYKLYGIGEGEV